METMGSFVKVAKKGELEAGRGTIVEVEGTSVALFTIGGKVYAIKNVCPHATGPVGEGDLEGNVVTCPWHGWQFDVTTGENQMKPQIKVETYPVKIVGDDILIQI